MMGGVSDGESSYPKTRLRDCEPSLGDSFFLYGLWKEFSVAQMLSSSLSIHCVTECHGLYSLEQNVTQPLLHLEDTPLSSSQTHG